eukprot:jgi/Galph1/3921/GphlegSOOS_G2633.1
MLKEYSIDVLLLVAGEKGVIRVINVSQHRLERSLIGHGSLINSMVVHPKDSTLLATASDDESARLWNIQTGALIAIFAGHYGHRGGVLYVDFDILEDRLVTSGMDKGIKIWSLARCREEIQTSHRAAAANSMDGYSIQDANGKRQRLLKTRFVQFPIFSTFLVHDNYVDCVMFVGNFIVSKSINNRILLWQPHLEHDDGTMPVDLLPWNHEYTVLAEFPLSNAEEWYIRFGMSWDRNLLAAGNTKGIIRIWNMDDLKSHPLQELNLHSKEAVSQCAFSPDGNVLIAACLDGKVYRWELETTLSSPHGNHL